MRCSRRCRPSRWFRRLVFLYFVPNGGEGHQDWQIFIGSTPLFWVPHFVAGMLMSRVLGISRFERGWREQKVRWFAAGDLAVIALLAISLTEPQSLPWRHILRHGLLMPLFMLVLYDFALGRGVFARLFSLPGMNFLGQTSFSIFIWQNFLMGVAFMVMFTTGSGSAALWVDIVGVLVVSTMSTYWFEKPVARRLRRRFAEPEASRPLELARAS